ncbi:homoserine kinase [Pseudochrobactrum algeriensis]|uniref:homoserine kinase n=1 Tax=Pseudochrobactrum algeriensis TaxID=2834768 RepID=UPI001BCCB25D|nr:homoserine kinase [Pseudochrobactrum algeriensis]MBX8814070.1 homoserine kinase [Ochrobactrum sp. MR34]QVQ37525.1 homoserine kinase [Pseudochrobactrum algeriensis]QVQ40746.1 homoserine kinase [Pseudochrobactrum algeriensis]QVQ44668.1 homoserine kinase [Pseudochrobactrum algeriensis]
MAVYTDINEIELAAYLENYNIGTLLSFKGIAEGVENSNFLLRTTEGTFILTLYEKRVDRDDLPFFIKLMQHLAVNGIECPQPVVQKNGEAIGELAGRPSAIVTFLEGMWLRKPAAEHCYALGVAMAQMHLAGQNFAMERENSLTLKDWRPLWEKCMADADAVEAGLRAQTEADLAYLEQNWPSDLPRGVIHADLFPDNVFFIGPNLSGIIDFYFACTDMLAYDLAICLNAWCFERDFSYNLTKGTALLRGYNSVRPLSAQEQQALPVLCRGAALRFMLTRLYDWINVPADSFVTKKDPMEYLRRMRFHREVRSASEYGQ